MSYREDNRVALENDAPRLDIVEKVTGSARYTTDYYLPNMLWAAYIRSDYGDARLRKSNVDAARAVKGVLEVEIEKQAGRYHGDRLGHVCAESRQALEQALPALDLKFEVRRPRTRLEDERTPLERTEAGRERRARPRRSSTRAKSSPRPNFRRRCRPIAAWSRTAAWSTIAATRPSPTARRRATSASGTTWRGSWGCGPTRSSSTASTSAADSAASSARTTRACWPRG